MAPFLRVINLMIRDWTKMNLAGQCVSGDSLEIILSPGSRAPLCLHRFDSKYPIPVSCILLPNIINQRKTIVNSWVRCLENNQLVITSGFPTVNFRK